MHRVGSIKIVNTRLIASANTITEAAPINRLPLADFSWVYVDRPLDNTHPCFFTLQSSKGVKNNGQYYGKVTPSLSIEEEGKYSQYRKCHQSEVVKSLQEKQGRGTLCYSPPSRAMNMRINEFRDKGRHEAGVMSS